jgi:beta-glucanase (GH16 family)
MKRAAVLVAALVMAGCAAPPPPGPAADPHAGWVLAFSDEFIGTTLDRTQWTDESSAEADDGHGNLGNDQLEWNQAANCTVSGGVLVLTARREAFTAPSGTRYDWTSCLLSSSYAFRYGYVEERAVLPAAKGFWPAFWTWQAPGVDLPVETDVYEFYSADRHELDLTQHSGGGTCRWRPGFDPTAGWHTYAAAIEPSGTVWYVDGAEVCRTDATSGGTTNLITNLAVHAADPPPLGVSTAVKRVDYIRVWQRG